MRIEKKAIVTDIAGTTRDTLEESLLMGDVRLNIVDTAGIRDTQDKVEKIGVERAKSYAADADLIIYVVDCSEALDENDKEIIHLLKNKKVIVLMNKSDLKSVISEDELKLAIRNGLLDADHENLVQNETLPAKTIEKEEYVIIKTSTVSLSENGMQELEHEISRMFLEGKISQNHEVMITNLRHKEKLEEAYDSLLQVLQSIHAKMPEDFYSIDLMSAYSSLGMIIGEEVGEDLVNEIFSKFCMGK